MTADVRFEPVPEADPAGWLAGRVRGPEPGAREFRVRDLVPAGFQAYARVFHPARDGAGRPVRWQEVARRHGRAMHAEAQWHAIGGAGVGAVAPPEAGHLPLDAAGPLAAVLRRFTSTPEACYFGVWDGWGGLEAATRWPGAARFRLPLDRTYVLLRGPVEAAARSVLPEGGVRRQSASVWWPADGAWCVVTDVDWMWTYVAGSRACVAAVLAAPELEAWETRPEHRLDAAGDGVNRG